MTHARKEKRYWILFDMDEYNIKDLKKSIKDGVIQPIVDEKHGGIIAYGLGTKHTERIVKKLNKVNNNYGA